MALVEAARFSTLVEGDIARGALEAAGLHAVLFDTQMNFSGGFVGGIPVRLMVLDEDLEAAQAVLAEGA